MSKLADAMRDRRRHWAASGGSHDVIVRTMQLGLPLAVGALVAIMLVAPFSHHSEVSFLLDKKGIDVVQNRMMVESAQYSGIDSAGRPFSLSARNAVQRSAADPVVRMQQLDARITMSDGPAMLTASAARYDPSHETVAVDGGLRFQAADGYNLVTTGVGLDLKNRTLSSSAPVSGSLPIGQFSANRMSANLDTRVVRLSGNVRLRINQGVLR